MVKRKRTLPQDSSKAKPRSKAGSPGGSVSGAARGKQSHLAIHVVEDDCDSDSDTINSASSKKNSPKPGQFVKSQKKQKKTPTANSSASKTAAAPTVFATRGVSIRFPFVPYQSQQDMMSKIVEALQKKENALLESPTGSGKSLALLCGALAWMETEKENRTKEWKAKAEALEKELAKQGVVESPYFSKDGDVDTSTSTTAGCGPCQGSCSTDAQQTVKTELQLPTSVPSAAGLAPGRQDQASEDDEDFEPQVKAEKKVQRKVVEINYESPVSDKTKLDQDDENAHQNYNSQPLPKIYFGTRTHKQITQLVKELKSNTGYRPEMVVLGSRNHYCINPTLKKTVNKNDGCQDLLDDPYQGCLWKHNVRELEVRAMGKIWDMEDMIVNGKSKREIRKAMDIDLDNAIVILDEAHNIEDAARDAGGLDLLDKDLLTAQSEFNDMLASVFLKILDDQTTFKIQEYEQSTEIWTSQELLASLEKFAVTRRTIRDYDNACQEISKELKEQKEKARINKLRGLTDEDDMEEMYEAQDLDEGSTERPKPRRKKRLAISPAVLRAMEEIVIILRRLLDTEHDCRDDYRIAIVELLDRTDAANRNTIVIDGDSSEGEGTQRPSARFGGASRYAHSQLGTGAQWRASKKARVQVLVPEPRGHFRPLSMKTRSVILTSGTLSPMDSFASELQASFPIRLEAGHVVDHSQVWTGVMPYGPTKVKIDGTFRSVNSFAFQDELGTVVERIVKTTPHGVLCFVSSYTMLEKLLSRWKDTGEYARLSDQEGLSRAPNGHSKGI
ncbi:unnamed protein product [Mortierella alpina]